MSIETAIASLYPEFSRNSLLERALERIKASATPERDLEILQNFTVTLPEEDYLLFSGVDVKVDKRIRVAAVGTEYWHELETIYPLFENADTQLVCLRVNGEVWIENLSKEFVRHADMSFPRESIDVLIRTCGYGVKGMKPLVITDAETGLKINYAANGFKKDPMPAIIVRRAVEI